ncbi:hypothetical protein [Myxococcus sp. AS-1-15]|uniref:hypothetical protein n=1 Tax=Myxococcus sp. AS-1-15 TaxID=2874600 RepID=UPI001CBAA275|nr:hypothetical protein [Myxococcus sp. AS-1-15]MBZ4398660.1 hypothetical protein [Myxococcus sp. AS-1-15]
MATDRAVTTAELRKRVKDVLARLDHLEAFSGTEAEYDAANAEATALGDLADATERAAGRPGLDEPEPAKA